MRIYEQEYLVGIDIGTTTVSAVVLDVNKRDQVDAYTIADHADIPTDFVWEKIQDVRLIADTVLDLLQSITQKYDSIKAIGITGQMHGIVYLDSDGSPVSPLYTWQDERAGLGSPSFCEVLEAKTGYRIAPGYGLATHYANQQNGQVPQGAVKLCTVMDYIVMKLTGRKSPLTHVSNAASFGLFDMQNNTFDREAVQRSGMKPDILPDVTAESVIAGEYNGIPVAAAIGDNQASFFGSVQDPAKTALANFGTGSQISLVNYGSGDFKADSAMEIRPYVDNRQLYSGSALCGGRAYALIERFFRKYMAACGAEDAEQYEVMNDLAMKALESGKYLHVRTAFCGTRNDSSVRGSISGISEELLTPEAFIAGTLWGMASELHAMFLKIPHEHIEKLVISGNAVRKNPALQKMLKAVFDMEVSVPVHKEEAAFGAALFAGTVVFRDSRGDLTSGIRYCDI